MDNSLPERDISALMRTNRAFYDLLITQLYKKTVRSGHPALFWCYRNGFMAPVKRILSLKADVNSHWRLFAGEVTPLMEAARAGFVGITRLLLEHGAKVDLCNPGEGACEPPLTLAAAEDKNAFLCFPRVGHAPFGRYGDVPDEPHSDWNVFDMRVAERPEDVRNYQDVVKLLLNHGANPNNTTNGSKMYISPLMVAAIHGNIQTAKILLEHGASLSPHFPVYATKYGPTEVEWESPLKMACYLESSKRYPMLDLLLEYGADINLEDLNGETLIFEIVGGEGDAFVDLIRELCKRGARPSQRNILSQTPLHMCHSSEGMVKVLLENGAEVNVQDHKGRTALFRNRELPVLKQLLVHGADPNICDNIGDRPLTDLVSSGNYDAVKLMLDHGADTNYELAYGDTNLHAAAMRGYASILRLCLEHRADLGIKAHDSSTAWDVAEVKECRGILFEWATRTDREEELSGRIDLNAEDESGDEIGDDGSHDSSGN
ncbi:unnamed protein product [Penicillium glandicola]